MKKRTITWTLTVSVNDAVWKTLWSLFTCFHTLIGAYLKVATNSYHKSELKR